jgi:hypothetical protein
MITSTSPHDRDARPEVESLERWRRQMLATVVVTTILWFVPQILQTVLADGLPAAARAALVVAGLLAALVWMLAMWRYHRFQQRVHADPELRRRLDDERVLALRREAIYRGWLVLVVAVALGVAVAPFVELPDQAVLLTLLLIGVDAPIVFFLALDRD